MRKLIASTLMIICTFSIVGCSKDKDVSEVTASAYAQQLFDSKNQYIGDNTADSKILELLNITEELGEYEFEIQADVDNYVIQLNFKNTIEDNEKRAELDSKMMNKALLILALIDNANEVRWSYPLIEDGKETLVTVYESEANAKSTLKKDVKEFGKSEVQLQELLDYLGIN